MRSILVLKNNIFGLPEGAEKEIKEIVPSFDLKVIDSSADYSEPLKKSEIVFGWPKTKMLKEAEKLNWLQLPSAGVDRYADQSIYYNKKIRVTNASGVYGKPIAEHIFAMIMAHNRNLIDYAFDKKAKKWEKRHQVKDLFNSVFGIIGLGDIGTTTAKRAKAWGAEVVALKRTMTAVPDYVDKIYLKKDINKLLKKSDFIILALPATPETEGIISEKELKMMKKSAFIVNIGRGSLIDEQALITALKEDWIAGAGLDVTENEPPAKDNELWELDNLILTPHSSGFSPTNDLRRFDIFKRNLRHYLNKDKLINQLDFKLKY